MPWIRVFTDFDDNPKTIRLKEILKNPLADAYPQRLWRWALKHAPGGNLEKHSQKTISTACGWKRDPAVFMRAMIEAGFIDTNPLQVHDWQDGSGQYETLTASGRARVAKHRSNASVTVTSPLRNRYVTLPDSDPDSDPDLKDQNHSITRAPKPRAEVVAGFAEFWQAYPRKVGKAAALKAWLRLKPDPSTVAAITQAVENQRSWPQWTKDSGQFIPHPSTWLNGRRWEDEAPELERWEPPDDPPTLKATGAIQ